MKIKLTGDFVMVKPLKRERITRSNIELPAAYQHMEPHYAEVVEVGPGRLIEGIPASTLVDTSKSYESEERITYYPKRYPMSVKAGDRIFYSSTNAYPMLYNGTSHLIIHDYGVFGVVEEEEGQKLRESLIADVSKTNSDAECPEHGKACGPWYAMSDGKKGLYCPQAHKFYPEEELKGE